jgi:hypothetical protein
LATEHCKDWPPGTLVAVLLGTAPLAAPHPSAALGCLSAAVEGGALSREGVRSALAAADSTQLEGHIADEGARAWLAGALPSSDVGTLPASEADALCNMLLGVTGDGRRIDPQLHGCLARASQVRRLQAAAGGFSSRLFARIHPGALDILPGDP